MWIQTIMTSISILMCMLINTHSKVYGCSRWLHAPLPQLLIFILNNDYTEFEFTYSTIVTKLQWGSLWPFSSLELFIPLHLGTSRETFQDKLDLPNNLLCTSIHTNKQHVINPSTSEVLQWSYTTVMLILLLTTHLLSSRLSQSPCSCSCHLYQHGSLWKQFFEDSYHQWFHTYRSLISHTTSANISHWI